MYQLVKDYKGEVIGVVKDEGEIKKSFGFQEENTDYQEYLKWVAEGNQPLPADE